MGSLIWLASYPKSGNTWLRAFLYNLLRNPPTPAPINDLDKFCLGESAAGWFAHRAKKPVDGMTLDEVMALRPDVQRDFTKAFPDSVFVKTHNFMGDCLGHPLHNMQVTAGAIYVVRDPRDLVISMTHHYGIDLDAAIVRLNSPEASTETADGHVAEIHNDWSTHVKSWTQNPNPGLHVVRYEDMLDRPNRTFGGIARFLGLDPEPQRLAKAVKFSSFEVLRRQEREGSFKERSAHSQAFFRSGKQQQWRTVLSQAQVDTIESHHNEQMRRFSYIL